MGYRWMKLDAGGLKVSDDRTGREVTISQGSSGLEVHAGRREPEAVASNMAAAIVFALEELRTPFAMPRAA